MTDRDTFAAAALTGLLAAPTDKDRLSEYWARFSYEVADAMLAVRDLRSAKETSLDAVPAAIAPADSHAPRGAVDRESVGTDKAEPLTRDCGTGDISDAQIDALECVVEDGRIVGMSVYGHLRSLLVRLRPEWEDDTPRPPTTPPQGSVPDEGSVSDSREWNEPVAWATFYPNGSTASVYIGRVPSHAAPLYRQPQPTLTDEEREAVDQAIDAASGMASAEPWAIDTLRKLLERLA